MGVELAATVLGIISSVDSIINLVEKLKVLKLETYSIINELKLLRNVLARVKEVFADSNSPCAHLDDQLSQCQSICDDLESCVLGILHSRVRLLKAQRRRSRLAELTRQLESAKGMLNTTLLTIMCVSP
jgi:hypothetical protein